MVVMPTDDKMGIFDVVLLLVGIGAAVLGFQLINQVYKADNSQISWPMITAIFTWLTLLLLFILLSLMVDVSKKELNEIKALVSTLTNKKRK